MSEKFTPGPWHITEEDWVTGGYDIAVIQDKDGELGLSANNVQRSMKKGRGSNDGEQKIQGTRRGNREVGIWYTEQAGV